MGVEIATVCVIVSVAGIGYLIFLVGCEEGKKKLAKELAGEVEPNEIPDGQYQVLLNNGFHLILKAQEGRVFLVKKKLELKSAKKVTFKSGGMSFEETKS